MNEYAAVANSLVADIFTWAFVAACLLAGRG